MHRKVHFGLALLSALAILLAACRAPAPDRATPTRAEPNAIFTAAAQTAEAGRIGTLTAATQTVPPPPPTDTLAPATPTVQATQPISPTAGSEATPTAGGGGQAAAGNRADFVTDVSVPDGTVFASNATFTKTWRIKNVGTTTWNNTYSLAFVNGAQMEAPEQVPVPIEVLPNAEVDISVNMTAPADPGQYIGYWMLRDTNGNFFGIGPDANWPIYVDITVGQAGAGASGTPTASGTPAASAGSVSQASISVDNPDFTGACPHTFTFNIGFVVNGGATVTYRLEADTGFALDLPAPVTSSLSPGTYSFPFTLEFSSSVDGWAQLHVTAPNDSVSNRVNFSLTCQ